MTRRPSQSDLEKVVGHFLHYLSNEPDPKTGVSPRTRLYGSLPIESKMLFPDVSDDVIMSSVRDMLAVLDSQKDILSPIKPSWRSYS